MCCNLLQILMLKPELRWLLSDISPWFTVQRLGEKIRALRLQRGMTVRELADALGYRGHSHISDIEHGKREPRVSFVLKVAQFFQVTTDQLLRDELEIINSASDRQDDTSG